MLAWPRGKRLLFPVPDILIQALCSEDSIMFTDYRLQKAETRRSSDKRFGVLLMKHVIDLGVNQQLTDKSPSAIR